MLQPFSHVLVTLILSFTRIQSNTSLAKSLSTNTFFRYLSYFPFRLHVTTGKWYYPSFLSNINFRTGQIFFLPFCFIISIYRQATTFTAIYGPSHSGQFPEIPRQINRYLCGINTSSRTQFPFDIPFQNTRFFSLHTRVPIFSTLLTGLETVPIRSRAFHLDFPQTGC